VKALASILKEKTEGLDVYRYHSPTLRVLDYATQFGKLMKNKDIVDAFESVARSEDAKVKKSSNKLLGNKNFFGFK